MGRVYDEKLAEAMSQLRLYCKCGHSVVLPMFREKQLCSWCGHYVFRDKSKEFNYKLLEKLQENRRKNEKSN